MKYVKIFFLILLWCGATSFSGPKMTVDEYINTYKNLAISEMKRVGIPASITLAQGILESGTGNSRLATEGNNHFGIKCHSNWTGKTMYVDDDAPNECFRVYNSAYDSYIDHSNFLYGKPRYAELFTYKINDYKSWAHGLKKAGYATNPNYAPLLIDLIEKYQLYKFDDPNIKPEIYAGSNPTPNETKPITNTKPVTIDINIEPVVKPKMDPSAKKLIFLQNGVKATKALKNDDTKTMATRFAVPLTDLLEDNDLTQNMKLEEGQIMYLQPKKKKSKKVSHIVQPNENMWKIAQITGVKLDLLLKRNYLEKGQEPVEGETIFLSKKAPFRPKLKEAPKKQEPVKVDPVKNTPVVTKPLEINEPKPVSILDKIKQLDTMPEKQVEVNITYGKDTLLTTQQGGIKSIIFEDVIPLLEENMRKELPEDDDYLLINRNVEAHYVKQGETLYSIAKFYGLKVDDLIDMNKLETTTIKPGDVLIIKK